MIRTVLTPDVQNISIQLPAGFIGKQVEVIAFTLNDIAELPDDILDKPMTHFASEKVLAKDWLANEENIAWQDL